MQSRCREIVESLIASTQAEHPAFARLLLQSLPANEKAWVDGSVCFELHHDNHATPLTDAQHWLLTGTHPGLPFEIEVEGEEHPYLGLVTFSRENSLPKFIEVNAMVSGKSLAEGGRFALRVSSPGQDPNWPGWEMVKRREGDV